MEFSARSLQTCTVSAQWSVAVAFIIDKEVLKTGLIIFRRGDVEHRNFYCRIKLPKEDRYKTISLHTADRESARDRAFDQDADIRFRVKRDVAVFNRPFRQVAEEYLQTQQRLRRTADLRCDRGHRRPFRTVIGAVLTNHPNRTLADLRRKLVPCRHHGSFSQIGAS
jgi:hypothetical protein